MSKRAAKTKGVAKSVEYIGFIRYDGPSLEEGYFDARKSAKALLRNSGAEFGLRGRPTGNDRTRLPSSVSGLLMNPSLPSGLQEERSKMRILLNRHPVSVPVVSPLLTIHGRCYHGSDRPRLQQLSQHAL